MLNQVLQKQKVQVKSDYKDWWVAVGAICRISGSAIMKSFAIQLNLVNVIHNSSIELLIDYSLKILNWSIQKWQWCMELQPLSKCTWGRELNIKLLTVHHIPQNWVSATWTGLNWDKKPYIIINNWQFWFFLVKNRFSCNSGCESIDIWCWYPAGH